MDVTRGPSDRRGRRNDQIYIRWRVLMLNRASASLCRVSYQVFVSHLFLHKLKQKLGNQMMSSSMSH